MGTAFRAGILCGFALLAAAPAFAQTAESASSAAPVSQPFSGFVSPYEVMRTMRAAGFNPLAPPLREGTDYVLRATDYRGVLMHVVVDARTGAIRDAVRIVPGPGRYGQYAGVPPYDGADLNAAVGEPDGEGMGPPTLRAPPAFRPGAHPVVTLPFTPPLPRPRPVALASPKDESPKSPPAASGSTPAQPSAGAEGKPAINSEVVTAPPQGAPPKSGKIPPPLTINN